MEVKFMSELELNGVLFLNYPAHLSVEESRERLEMEISLVAVNAGVPDDEVCVSPFWISRALAARAASWFDSKSEAAKTRILDRFWRTRCQRLEAKGVRNIGWALYRPDSPEDVSQPKPKQQTRKEAENG